MMRTFLIALALLAPLPALAQSACSAGVPLTARLESELSATVPSASVGVYALLENTGSEILRDASIAVEVAEKETGTVVDRFVVPQNVVIFGGSSAKIGFVWRVPSAIADGVYTITAIYAPPLSMRAAVFSHAAYPEASIDIAVSGGRGASIAVESLAVNAQAYRPLSVAVMTQGSVVALAEARNVGEEPYRGALTWSAYAADAKLADLPLDERAYPVELHPGTGRALSYDVPSGRDAYYIEGRFTDGRAQSLFSMQLDRGTGAFPWASCAPAARAAADGARGPLIALAVGAILVLGLFWELYERRKRLS